MIKRIILIAALIAVLVGGLVSYFYFEGNFSDGFRAGIIVKFSEKGYVFKTNEGQLQLGNSNTIWDFSVEHDPAVLKQIEEATEGGYRVKVFYNEKYYQFDYRGDTKYIVYKVEKVE